MGNVVLGLLSGITAVETSITFILFIEEEAIQMVQMAIFEALKYNKKATAMRLLSSLEVKYLKSLEDDLVTIWGGGLGFDIGNQHYSIIYSHGTFDLYAKAVRDLINAYKIILGMPGADISYLTSAPD